MCAGHAGRYRRENAGVVDTVATASASLKVESQTASSFHVEVALPRARPRRWAARSATHTVMLDRRRWTGLRLARRHFDTSRADGVVRGIGGYGTPLRLQHCGVYRLDLRATPATLMNVSCMYYGRRTRMGVGLRRRQIKIILLGARTGSTQVGGVLASDTFDAEGRQEAALGAGRRICSWRRCSSNAVSSLYAGGLGDRQFKTWMEPCHIGVSIRR